MFEGLQFPYLRFCGLEGAVLIRCKELRIFPEFQVFGGSRIREGVWCPEGLGVYSRYFGFLWVGRVFVYI